MTEAVRTAFIDFKPSDFPFTITAYPVGSVEDIHPVWTIKVDGPGALTIPGFQDTGVLVRCVVEYANGRVDRIDP